jgi:hypothetical protein
MATLRELKATASAAMGHRRYALGSTASFVAGIAGSVIVMLGWPMTGFLRYLPALVGTAVAALLTIWWLLDYGATLRTRVRGIENLEAALDELSTYFDEANAKIFNGRVTSDVELGRWQAEWHRWCDKVEKYLEAKFGLRERNIFRNLVLVKPLWIPDSFNAEHNHQRCMVAQQLEKIRES